MSRITGKVSQIIGPVIDVEFNTENELPKIYDSLEIKKADGSTLVLEVQQHIGEDTVRTISMDATDGLSRGTEVVATGNPIQMPIGNDIYGRLFNVTGEAIDGLGNLDKEGKEYRYYADRMHDTNTRMLLTHMTQYVKKHNNKDTYSFLVGFLCHYALDVKIHPYVYYNVGLYDKKDPSTHQYRGLHMKFERSIDAVMIQQDEKMKAHKYRLTKKYFPLKQVPEDVENILGYALKQTYGKDNGNEMYRNGVKTMHFNVKHIITDRFGIKKKAYQLLDLFNKETDMFYQDLSFYKHIEEYDYLNDKKNSCMKKNNIRLY